VVVGLERLHETGPFLRGFLPFSVQPARLLEDAVDARRADGDHVVVEHHERQSPIAVEWKAVVEGEDRLLLPRGQPVVAGNLGVVLVDAAVPLPPLVELAGAEVEPGEQLLGRQFRSVAPAVDVIDDLVARVVGNPNSFQSSPAAFFLRRQS
jgi:hypothetical protein